jgi:hypothetical protein
VPINTALTGEGLKHTFRTTKASVAVVDEELLEPLQPFLPETVIVHGHDDRFTSLAELPAAGDLRPHRRRDPRVRPGRPETTRLLRQGHHGVRGGTHCARNSAAFMVPRYIEFLPRLPKTPTEKVEKFRLRQAGVTPGTWDRQA